MSPVIIPKHLPANKTLRNENIFVMNAERALHQDIRPLHILIVNLMPIKEVTEEQLLRLLGNTLLQVEITLLHMASHESKNTSQNHLEAFYKTLDDIKMHRYDAMIVTGAPVETLPYEEVTYWNEFCDILEWAKDNVFSSFFICWAAQAALYTHYGIDKEVLPKKLFGIYQHSIVDANEPLFRGFDDHFEVPHSRHTRVSEAAVYAQPNLQVISSSPESGIYIVADRVRKNFYITGHPEYDRDTLAKEYYRDLNKGLAINMPEHYFKNDEPKQGIDMNWKGHAHLLFSNWLNYYVYQLTDYHFIDSKSNTTKETT